MIILIAIAVAIGIALYSIQKWGKKPPTADQLPTGGVDAQCDLIEFNTSTNFNYTATWVDCLGFNNTKEMSVGETITVCAKPDTASGGPFTIVGKC